MGTFVEGMKKNYFISAILTIALGAVLVIWPDWSGIDSYGWNPAHCLHQSRENRLLFQIQHADEYYSDFIGSLGMYTT